MTSKINQLQRKRMQRNFLVSRGFLHLRSNSLKFLWTSQHPIAVPRVGPYMTRRPILYYSEKWREKRENVQVSPKS